MTNEPMQVPGITDKRIIPPGVLPKNIQPVALGGLAVAMVIVFFFSGRNNPKPQTTNSTVSPSMQTPNADKLNDYRKRIEEESNKLAQEQAELARSKGALKGTTDQLSAGQGQPGPGAPSYAPRSAYTQSAEEPSQSNWIAQESAKREYTSRFASNLALTLRGDQKPAGTETVIQPGQALPPLDPRLYPWPMALPPGSPSTQAASEVSPETPKPVDQSARQTKPTLPDLNRSAGKGYRLFEGTIIETVLTNRLDGTFSGPVNCLVSYEVYSHDHSHILIPSGSRVLGDVHPVESSGQSRLAVTFHRLVMPDGFSINLDQFRGLDQVGATGLRDQVNHHYMQIFGASIAIGMIAGLAQNNTQYGIATSATDAYRQGVATSLSQSSMHVLDRFLNILPTFTIREGQRIKVYLAEDLTLPAYDNHQIPGDI